MKRLFAMPARWRAYVFVWLLAQTATASELALTIYNQNFAVVRDHIALDLKAGVNKVRFSDATVYLEPSSVILRDPSGKHQFQVLEQNFRGDPVSQEMLLDLNEGKTIDFEALSLEAGQTKREIIPGKIIRSGAGQGYSPYGGYSGTAMQPIIEVNGKLRFSLPGQPIFPALADNTILKPTLHWVIESEQPAQFEAELGYVTGEMRWEADYNLVLPEKGNTLDLVGWITMDNECGKSFHDARIKLMAGDVSKIQSRERVRAYATGGGGGGGGGAPPVTEKAFDEYHLYTLERPTTLLDREKKQVEFVRAAGVKSAVLYVYDGAQIAPEQIWDPESLHTEAEYGTRSNKKVWVKREFTNSAANHLGLPLPKGRLRVYRRDAGGQLEFTGENVIDHTPRDELVRLHTGNAFDLIGERKRTQFSINVSGAGSAMAIDPTTGLPVAVPRSTPSSAPWIDESFEVTLRNHKKEPVEVRVVEHLYRWVNWVIEKKSDNYRKTDSQTIEFPLQLKPDSEQTISYSVHYTW
jgi:hypothetical protein